MKVYVAGPFQSGKSTAIRGLDSEGMSIDYQKGEFSTTVGMDFGMLFWIVEEERLLTKSEFEKRFDDYRYSDVWEVIIIGTPGQKRFAPVREVLATGASGMMFVVDSTKIGQVGIALAIYEEVRAYLGKDTPVVILANKQDLEGAANIDLIKDILRIDPRKVFGTSATQGENLNEALMALLETIRRREFEEAARAGIETAGEPSPAEGTPARERHERQYSN